MQNFFSLKRKTLKRSESCSVIPMVTHGDVNKPPCACACTVCVCTWALERCLCKESSCCSLQAVGGPAALMWSDRRKREKAACPVASLLLRLFKDVCAGKD